MNKMEEVTIVTLEENERYALVDKTEQNGKVYYLATEVDKDNAPLEHSVIFEEIIEDGEKYLEEVEDQEVLDRLGAVFIINFNELVMDGELA